MLSTIKAATPSRGSKPRPRAGRPTGRAGGEHVPLRTAAAARSRLSWKPVRSALYRGHHETGPAANPSSLAWTQPYRTRSRGRYIRAGGPPLVRTHTAAAKAANGERYSRSSKGASLARSRRCCGERTRGSRARPRKDAGRDDPKHPAIATSSKNGEAEKEKKADNDSTVLR